MGAGVIVIIKKKTYFPPAVHWNKQKNTITSYYIIAFDRAFCFYPGRFLTRNKKKGQRNYQDRDGGGYGVVIPSWQFMADDGIASYRRSS